MYFNFVIITILLCTFIAENSASNCSPCDCELKENKMISVSCLSKTNTIPVSVLKFQNASQINELDFKGHYFEELNVDISHLYNTEKIIFSNNSIRKINIDFFKNLTNLETLKLDGNQISDIQTGLFKYNRKIKYIFLNSNKIKYLQKNLFENLPDLMEMHLNDNQIEIIEDYCFIGVPSLTTLDLHDNKLQTLNKTFIDNPENLKLVYLEKNPWKCVSKQCDLINISLRKNWQKSLETPQCFDSSNISIRNWEDVQILESLKIQKFDTNEIVCQVETCAEKQIMYWSYKEQILDNVTYCMQSQTHTITYTFSKFDKKDEGLYTCFIKNCSFCQHESRNLIETNNEQITTTNIITEDTTTTELSVTDETTETTEATTTPKPEVPKFCLKCIICLVIGLLIGLVLGLIGCLPLMILCKSFGIVEKIFGKVVKKMVSSSPKQASNEAASSKASLMSKSNKKKEEIEMTDT